jgi:hypothetical protein
MIAIGSKVCNIPGSYMFTDLHKEIENVST